MDIHIYFGDKKLRITQQSGEDKAMDLSGVDVFWDGAVNEATLYHHSVEEAFKAIQKKYKYIEAAGGLVKNADGAYLLMYRRGKWDLPKGKAEKGETIEQTALREVEEETSVTGLSLQSELPSTYHMYTEKGKVILKRTYWFLMETQSGKTLQPQTEEGIEEVTWLKSTEMEEVIRNTYPSVLEVLKHVQ